MTQPPQLTDRDALRRTRARAQRLGVARFLHDIAIDNIKERLTEVNRSFTAPAIVTGHPAIWADAFPGATVVPDTDVLDLQAGAHDLVIHAMAMHWAGDPIGQLIQCRHALRPDGLFLAVLPGGQTLAELRAALAQAESDLTGGLSPRVVPMAELRDLGALLQRAGMALPVADSMPFTATYPALSALVRDLRGMGETNALAQRHRAPAPRGLFALAARHYAEAFAGPDGRLPATFELVFLTGWAPDASQPQPLRPGSARARLADALDTRETPLPDPAAPSHRD